MPKPRSDSSDKNTMKRRPALTPEARENQMIALAINAAEKQLMDGTASSQIITHYLKLATTKEQLEIEILKKQKELITAKTETLQAAKRDAEMYEEVINAMKKYAGHDDDEVYDD